MTGRMGFITYSLTLPLPRWRAAVCGAMVLLSMAVGALSPFHSSGNRLAAADEKRASDSPPAKMPPEKKSVGSKPKFWSATFKATGRVVFAGDPNRTVPNATVRGNSKLVTGRDFDATTDSVGTFNTFRGKGEAFVRALSSDGLLTGIVEISPTENEIVIPVSPAVTARGRLVDKVTAEPWANQRLEFGIKVMLTGRTSKMTFLDSATTNALGEFCLTGLVAGQKYTVLAVTQEANSGQAAGYRQIGEFQTNGKKVLSLADWYSSTLDRLTFDERCLRAMPPLADSEVRFEQQLRAAQLTENRILVVAAQTNANSRAAQRFFEIYFGAVPDSQRLHRLLAGYTLLAIDTSDGPARKAAQPFFEKRKLQFPQDKDALFAIFDSATNQISVASSTELSNEGRLSGPKLYAFLKPKTATVPDAASLMAAALEQAKQQNKRVLLQHVEADNSACALLKHFLKRNEEFLSRDYVVVSIDERFTNGSETIKRYRPRWQPGAVPWIGILDSSGKTLIDSIGLTGNIGFPISPDEISHFQKMLSTTKIRLTEDDLKKMLKPQ